MKIELLVERMGDYWESSGRTPMRGRVFGYLLAADPKQCDFDTIRKSLDASKSAISLALTGLTDQGLVRAWRRPGKRKRYFEVDVEGWLERSKREMRQVVQLNELLQECQKARKKNVVKSDGDKLDAEGSPADRPAPDLALMIDFHEGFLRQVDAFVATWESARSRD